MRATGVTLSNFLEGTHMRSATTFFTSAAALTACVVFSACSGGFSSPTPLAPSGTASLAEVRGNISGRLYAGGPNANVVGVYPEFANNPKPIGEITSSLYAPTGMAVDDSGNVYVCNNAGSSVGLPAGKEKGVWRVTVYKRGATLPFRVYVTGVWDPVDVAVARDGTVYIANISSAVTVYPPNSTQPSGTLTGPSGQSPLGVAFDAAGNTFVSYVNPSGGGSIYQYAPGQNTGSNLGITFTGSPHGLAVDRSGNLVVAVSNAPNPGSAILVFAPGSKQPNMTIAGPFQPFMLAFSRNGARLFAADYGSGNNDGAVFVYSYPSGTLLFKDTQGAAADGYGVAVDPRAAP